MAVVIVGAGLAGLTCARRLHQQNIPVRVLEASDDVGGRVRSDRMDGYILDRGFQVLFDAYPAVRRNIDLAALDLQRFDPGAIIYQHGRHTVLTDPLRDRHWRDVVQAIGSTALPLIDKLRTLRLALQLYSSLEAQKLEPDTESSIAYLRDQGLSERAIDAFYRPFFAGILLLRDLSTTAAAFRYYLRMLATGHTVVPAAGMGAITQQLAAPLTQADMIRCDAPVAALLKDGDRVTGVRLESGEDVEADAVVLATEAPIAARLAGIETPEGALSTTAIYFAGTRQLYAGRKIVLNAEPDAFVNNCQLLTNVAPSYAPAGRHLLSAVVLGAPAMDDRELITATVRDLRRIFAPDTQASQALATYYPLRVYRIPYAQFPQPPGIYATLPSNQTTQPGLYIAAESTEGSSINGAMLSGERCAELIAQAMRGL